MKRAVHIVTCFALVLALPGMSTAQEAYKLPAKEVVDILDAPPTPLALVSPRGDLMLQVEYDPMPSIAHMARRMLRLARIRIIPQTNGRQRTVYYTGLVIQRLADGSTTRVALPEGAQLGPPRWSPDGRRFAFTRETDQGIELWIADQD